MTTITMAIAARCIAQAIIKGRNVYLHGAPGVGKSSLFRQVNDKLAVDLKQKRGFIDIRVSQRDPVDLRGLPVTDLKTNTTRCLTPDELPQEKRDGKYGMLLLDELSDASLAMQSACYQLALDKCIGEYKLPKGWCIVAAGNRIIDKAAAQRSSTALDNRFQHFEVEADAKVWCDWAIGAGIPAPMIAFIRLRPALIHEMPTKAGQHSFPTPRTWEVAADYLDQPKDLRIHLLASVVGDGPAAELEGFLQVYQDLPTVKDIEANPKTAKVPQNNPAANYAVAGAVARFTTRQNIEAMLIYAARLPREFEILAGLDMAKRDETLKNTTAYAKWAAGVSNFLT